MVFAHDAEHPLLPYADALMPPPRPDLPVTLAVKDALVENLANLLCQRRIRQSVRATFGSDRRLLLTPPSGVAAGPSQLPHCDHASHAIRSFAGRRKGTAHGFDFQKAKGRLP